MIISYSRKFCFIRVPKAGSTTAAMSIVDSGVLDANTDYCSNSIEFCQQGREPYAHQVPALLAHDRTHQSVHQYRELGMLPDDFAIYSTIRNPVDRFCSMVRFLFRDTNPNRVWDVVSDWIEHDTFDASALLYSTQNLRDRIVLPQHAWFGDDATLWCVEHLDAHLENFLGHVPPRERVNPRQSRGALTPDNHDAILSHYAQDFALWSDNLAPPRGFEPLPDGFEGHCSSS